MTKEQMISKLSDFTEECAYCDGFVAYMAYCYIFDIQYDEHIRIESKDMSFEAFREWLSDYINEYCSDVYEEITVFGIFDDVYVK